MSDYHSKYHCPFDWNSMYAESGHFASAPTMAPSAHNPCAYDASTGRSAFYQHPYQPPIGPFGHSFTQQLNISPDAVHLSHHSAPFSGSSIKSSPTDSGLGYSPTLFQSSPDHFTRSPQHSLPPTADCFSSSTVLPNHAQKMEASSSEIALPSIVHPFKSEKESKSSRQEKTRTDKYRVVYTDFQRSKLEEEFQLKAFIDFPRKEALSKELNLTQRQIKIWFQNRRAKGRKSDLKKSLNNGGYGLIKSQERVSTDCTGVTGVKSEDFGERALTVQIPPPVASSKLPVRPDVSMSNMSEMHFTTNNSYYHHFGPADRRLLLRPIEI
ncbi:Caudal type box transcription factor 1 a [Tyrophagus putrescentiae]|nr:Caudal type box transcription factor 1 a [Tyrophagus putrescentiae]